ncbi:MAG: hypothetical protein IKV31_07860 [Paludibacteraceae bacterium]|nr:hypothetical protein [Paludibacteraceae bacterium]
MVEEKTEVVTDEVKKPKVVVVVGNGFDLDLGFKTSYSDFVNSDLFQTLLIENYPNSYDVEPEYSRDMNIYPNSLADYIKKEEEYNNWVDLEECLREYCVDQGESLSSKIILREVNAVKYFLYKFISKIPRDIKAFSYYDKVSYKILCALVDAKADFEIWSFNYTYSCELLLEKLGYTNDMAKAKIHYVHSSLFEAESNNKLSLVLGCNYSEEVSAVCPSVLKNDMMPNYKRLKNQFDSHLNDVENIIFIGHSMGSTDRQYFKNVLESPNLKAITIITKDTTSLNNVRINLGKLPGDFEIKVKDGIFSYLKYRSDTYYQTNNPDKKGLNDLLQKVATGKYT